MPDYVRYAVISGQKNAGEIVVAASTMFVNDWQLIFPISADTNIRKEFLLALEAFSWRERHPIRYDKKYELAERLLEPNRVIPGMNEFWIALDEQGYALAKDIISVNGDLPDQTIYKSIHKLNLIEQAVFPPPQVKTSTDFWINIVSDISFLTYRQPARVSKATYQSFINTYVPMTSAENEYYTWFKSLYESLLPWRKAIESLQSVRW